MTTLVFVLLVLALLIGAFGGLFVGWWAALRSVPEPADTGAALAEVSGVRHELERMTDLVQGLEVDRAQQHGHVNARLEQAAHATALLATTTGSLRDALASPKSRGQWGERMAEDVLRSAGLVNGVNYLTQTATGSGSIPDFSFMLPADRMLHMDVKFPADNYLRYLETKEPSVAKAFLRDVRNRVTEVTKRGYVDAEATVPFVLLFIANESVYGFIHEQDPGLLDWALSQHVVLCSPTTLFAMLAVIRQGADQFKVERRSREILNALGGLRAEWEKYAKEVEKMGRGLASANAAFEAFNGPRRRAFETKLDAVDVLDSESFGIDGAEIADPSALGRSYPHAV